MDIHSCVLTVVSLESQFLRFSKYISKISPRSSFIDGIPQSLHDHKFETFSPFRRCAVVLCIKFHFGLGCM